MIFLLNKNDLVFPVQYTLQFFQWFRYDIMPLMELMLINKKLCSKNKFVLETIQLDRLEKFFI